MIESYFIRHQERFLDSKSSVKDEQRRGRKRERNCMEGHGLIAGLRELSLENKDCKNIFDGSKCRNSSIYCDSFTMESTPSNFDEAKDEDLLLWELYNSSDQPIKKRISNHSLKSYKKSDNGSLISKKVSFDERYIESKDRGKTLLCKVKLKSPGMMKKISKYKENNKENKSPIRINPISARSIARKPFKLPLDDSSSSSKDPLFDGIVKSPKLISIKSPKKLVRHSSFDQIRSIPSTPKHSPQRKVELKPKSFTEPRGKQKRKCIVSKSLLEPHSSMKPSKIARSDPGNLNKTSRTSRSLFKPLQDITNIANNTGVTPIPEKQCISCNSYDTPIWRHAEDGTELCNSCGIRWKKHHIRCVRCWFVPPRDEKNFDICPNCRSSGSIKKCNSLRRFSSSIY